MLSEDGEGRLENLVKKPNANLKERTEASI